MNNNINLIPYEWFFEVLNQRASTFNLTICSHFKGPVTPAIVRQALDIVQSRHPNLNRRIVGDLDCLQFETEGIQKIPLRVVDKRYAQHWQEIVTVEINEKIESSKCLMRALLVRAFDENDTHHLVTTIAHLISDGLSFVQLQSEILNVCQKITLGETVTQVTPLPALPSLDKLLPGSATTSALNATEIAEIDSLWFEKWVPIESRKSGWIYRQLDQTLTQQLKEIAKQEKVTLHGAFSAAMLLAITKIIRANQKIEVVRASCYTVANLRPYLKYPVSNEHLSPLAWVVPSWHTLQTNTSFWDLAREVKEQVGAVLKRGAFSRELTLGNFEQSIDLLNNKVEATVEISNLGKLNIPTNYGRFQLEEIHILTGIAAFGGKPELLLTEFRGKIFLYFLFSEPSLSKTTMEILANDVVSNLIDVCDKKKDRIAGSCE